MAAGSGAGGGSRRGDRSGEPARGLGSGLVGLGIKCGRVPARADLECSTGLICSGAHTAGRAHTPRCSGHLPRRGFIQAGLITATLEIAVISPLSCGPAELAG